eukprot:TRINITY_DN8744_c0_g1_i1.p1 TRINITY_DN8744_c0_g1~~TRINITY_DN8744_c0_g1_i1.p1  ORF type:complete len:247 (-),score=37.56 TRINITY_DN8744_c0_g1_i1:7-747(-)
MEAFTSKITFGVPPCEVTWVHAVNSKAILSKALTTFPLVNMLEADIMMSGNIPSVPIMCHPPKVESDLTFKDFITEVHLFNQKNLGKVGVKLDFKDPRAVEPCLEFLNTLDFQSPVWLNADLVQGHGGFKPPFDATQFLKQCVSNYPRGVLSIGWTIAKNLKDYSPFMIDEMLKLCKASGMKHFSFPVAAPLIRASHKEILRLLEEDTHTLTVWGEADDELRLWMQNNLPSEKTYYDVRYPVKSVD